MKIIKKVIFILIIGFLFCFFINIYVMSFSKKYIVPDKQKNYILVLGASVKYNRPSKMLQERLDTAISLYNNNKIIISGDSHDESYDEVSVMKEYLMSNGVLEDDIICDNKGFSTYDSMNNLSVSSVVVVTQKYHLYRSLYIARKMGIDAYGIDAMKVRYRGQTGRDIRESLAIIKDFFKVMFGGLK